MANLIPRTLTLQTSSPAYSMDQSSSSLLSMTDREDAQVLKKRPRPVMSCLECRKKKLKCDRLLPCQQCKKSGKATQCAYAPHENSPELRDDDGPGVRKKARLNLPSHHEGEHATGHDRATERGEKGPSVFTGPVLVAEVEDLKERVAQLERLLTNKLPHLRDPDSQNVENHTTPQYTVHQGPIPPPGDHQRSIVGMLVTKEARSQYYAPDRELPMLSRFDEALKVLHGLSKEPAAAFAMKEIKSARKLQAISFKLVESLPVDNISSIFAAMRAALPPHHVCEILTSTYFTYSESLLRILHQPSFLRDCEAFWTHGQELPRIPDTNVGDSILPQLVGVILIASSLGGVDSLSPISFSTETLYNLLKSWNTALHSKSQLQLPTLQTQCLLLLVQQMCPSEVGLLQNTSAALVRSAVKMGLHRDPCEFPKLSVFKGELRRRLWSTVVELDMQISFSSGGRPTIRYGDFSTKLAAVLDDDEIFEDMIDLPLFHVDKYGIPRDSLDLDGEGNFAATLGKYTQLRLKAFDFINRANCLASCDEALKQGRQLEVIRNRLRDKLANFTFSTRNRLKLSQSEILNSILVYVYLLRPSLSIYRQHGFREHASDATRLIEKSCVESSMDILGFLDLLRSTQNGSGNKYNSFEVFIALCKVDIMQAALSICIAVQAMDVASPGLRTYSSIDRSQIWSRGDLIERVHIAVSSLLDRKHEPIHDVRDPVCLAVVAQYLLNFDSPHLKERNMREGAYETINLYLENLRQSTAKSFFSADFTFKLEFASSMVGNGNTLKQNNTVLCDEGDLVQDMTLDYSEFNMDNFLDFGFPVDWDWQV